MWRARQCGQTEGMSNSIEFLPDRLTFDAGENCNCGTGSGNGMSYAEVEWPEPMLSLLRSGS